MAELVMTEEERKTPILKWDDANLGRAVKALAMALRESSDHPKMPGYNKLKVTAAAVMLIAESVSANSVYTTIELHGAHQGEQHFGNWKITMEKID